MRFDWLVNVIFELVFTSVSIVIMQLLWLCIASLVDWPKKSGAPFSQPIK